MRKRYVVVSFRGGRLILVVGLLAALLFWPRGNTSQTSHVHTAHAAELTGPCAAYPTPRTFIEGQGWWQDAGEDYFAQEHIHVGACVPLNGTVSGVLPVDLTIKLHNNEVGIWKVAADTRQWMSQTAAGCYGALACLNYKPALTCSAMDCTFTAHLDIPTQWIARDGSQLIRLFAMAKRADGHETRAGFEFPLKLANGNPVSDYPVLLGGNHLSGVGWHTDTQYSLAMSSEFPTAPVSGIWQPHILSAVQGTPITEYEVLLDPNIHAGSRGTVVAEGRSSLFGRVRIDTTKLANGTHKLVFRAGSQVAKGTNSGIVVIPFTVQN